jgi:putative heme-binding domain-containing protein
VSSSNDWYVRHSRRLLQQRAAAGVIDTQVAQRLVERATFSADDAQRLRAIWALHAIGAINNKLRNQFLTDTSPYVRGWTIQLSLETSTGPVPADLHNSLVKMASDDDSPVVRLYLASALQRMPLEQRWPILEGLVSHAADANDHNLPLMYWYAAEPLADLDPERALAFGLSAGESIPLLREFMLRRIGSGDSKSSLASLVKGLGRADTDSLRLTFLQAIRTALQGQRKVSPPAEWAAVAESLANSESDDVRLQARALGVTFGDAAALRELRQAVTSTAASVAERRESLQALLDANDPELAATLQGLIAEPQLREAALRGLAQYADPQTPAAVLKAYASYSPVEKRAALATLCSRTEYGLALMQAIEQKQLPGTDLTADLVRQLQYLKSEELTARLTDVWGNVRETAADKAKLIEQYKALASTHHDADPAFGRAVFVKTCNRCHKLYGVGGEVGPDLTGSNRANLDYLLSNIVDPSAVMAKEYRQSIVVTDNGRVITGIVRSEDDKAVTIQTAEAVVIVPKGEIVERVASEVSMMPDDQLKPFSEQQITSLIAYLSGSGQSPILATPDNAALLFNGQDLTGWTGDTSLWSVENGELVGRTSGLKRNEFLVSDLAAGDFRLSMEVKLVDNAGNSGVQFRSQAEGASVKGYQADIGQGWWGKLYEEHGRALLWSESGEKHLKPGEWNRYEIVAEGSRIRTFLNGQPCVDLDDPPGARRGVFALQLHSGGPTEVRYRNLKLEVLGGP